MGPQARDHARHSELWDLPVKELKANPGQSQSPVRPVRFFFLGGGFLTRQARLRAIGADFTGLAEKTELIMLLERRRSSGRSPWHASGP